MSILCAGKIYINICMFETSRKSNRFAMIIDGLLREKEKKGFFSMVITCIFFPLLNKNNISHIFHAHFTHTNYTQNTLFDRPKIIRIGSISTCECFPFVDAFFYRIHSYNDFCLYLHQIILLIDWSLDFLTCFFFFLLFCVFLTS